jgi:hypothetical protein
MNEQFRQHIESLHPSFEVLINADLLQDQDFVLAFTAAKARLRVMNIRVVEENNPLRQALLEMYVAVALAAPYNDFDNH